MKDISIKIFNTCKKMVLFILALVAIVAILIGFYTLIDFSFKNVLSYTSRAVLSNFIVFVSIIFIVSKYAIRPNELLEKAQLDITNTIKKSEKIKEESKESLDASQERIKKIDEEINAIVKNFENNAKQTGEKILKDAQKATYDIEKNTHETIKNNENIFKNNIIKKTSNALVEIAKNQIINELNKNPDLHSKLIEESIKAINLNVIQTEKV